MDALDYPLPRETRQSAVLNGDGGTGYGPFPFRIFDAGDVKVFVRTGGAGHFEPVAFTVTKTAAQDFDTFSITLGAAITADDDLVVISERLHERLVSVSRGGAIAAVHLEKELSKHGTVIQELRRDIDRGVRADHGQAGLVMNTDEVSEGKTLMRGPGNTIVPGPVAADIAAAQANAAIATQKAAEASDSADQAAGYAAGLNLPSLLGAESDDFLAVKSDLSGYALKKVGDVTIDVPALGPNQTIEGSVRGIELKLFDERVSNLMEIRPVEDRLVPRILLLETWWLTSFAGWVDRTTGLPAKVTEAHVRAIVTQCKRMGYAITGFQYLEIYGNFFTRPNFPLYNSYHGANGDAAVAGSDWMLSNPALNDDFDILDVWQDQSRIEGMLVDLNVGRLGVFNFIDHLRTSSYYTALGSLAAEKELATARARLWFDDLYARFPPSTHPHIVGYGLGYEPSHMGDWAPWAETVTKTPATGVYPYEKPPLNSYGKLMIMTPAILVDLPAIDASQAEKETYAGYFQQCGFNQVIAQLAAGPGTDYTTSKYTFQSDKAMTTSGPYYDRLVQVIRIANNSGDNFGKGISLNVMAEGWQMGDNPEVAVTLSGTTGQNITATFDGGLPTDFNASVGRWFAAGNGIAAIVKTNLPTSVTLDTTVTGARDFAGTEISANAAGTEAWALAGLPRAASQTPGVNLTLDVTDPADVQLSFGWHVYDLAVGDWICTTDGFVCQLTTLDSTLIVHGDSTVTDGRPAPNTFYTVGQWYVTKAPYGLQYAWGYAQDATRMLQQWQHAGRYSSQVVHLAGPPYACIDDLPLALPEAMHGRVNFRAEASSAALTLIDYRNAVHRRTQEGRDFFGKPIRLPDFGGLTLSSELYDSPALWTYAPTFWFTRVRIRVTVNMHRLEGVSAPDSLTILKLKINGNQVGNTINPNGAKGAFGGSFVLEYEHDAKGLEFTMGLYVTYDDVAETPADPPFQPIITSAQCEVMEVVP